MRGVLVRPILVGLCPSREGLLPFDPETPSARLLADLMRVSPMDLSLMFRLDNISPEPLGNIGRPLLRRLGKAYPVRPGRRYVLCGVEVARAVGLHHPELLVWTELRGALAAVLPHPSPKNLWYHDRTNVRRAGLFLRRVT
jgi:hypothetical protein